MQDSSFSYGESEPGQWSELEKCPDNVFYVCGELTELTFTAPAVGITMIRFTSGTTPTVCTINGVTKWMYDFDPTTDIEASKTYDINVLNGIGVAGWA